MDRWRGKVAVVTGAGAGIGAAISKRLAEEGILVVGFGRRPEKIEEVAKTCKGKIHAVKCDIVKQEDVVKAFKWVKENVGPVQILVNNAGIFKIGRFIDGNPEDWKAVLDTNVMGVSMCSREAFQHMSEANLEGHIVNINSIGGHATIGGGAPLYMNMYSPSKHALTCMTQLIRKEILHTNSHVKISSVSPGLVRTDIQNAAGIHNPDKIYEQNPALEAENVSDAVAFVISTPPSVNIPELIISPYGEAVV